MLKLITACSQEGCLNQTCKECHSKGPFYSLETVELKKAQGTPHPIIHMIPKKPTNENDSLPIQLDTPIPV
ncbi:hypothetical protein E2C01_069282 [Portunus trituberculatus]|uniref:Uncharacterized protein n=1 Tax=Portunus trituberculatus TaxID=210409 RepID=A0A5B7HU46_PORTR|nr:hypothetical protein [Portunus trituberculatus]